MTQLLTNAWRPLIAMIALGGSLLVVESAQAGHSGHGRCNPAAEAHMKTAIRLMNIACGKPIHASKALARAAVTHISIAQRFVRTPAANAELCGAKATLERFIFSHCAPPFHGAIAQTQFALDIERSVCVCGRPACRGGCQIPHAGPQYRSEPLLPQPRLEPAQPPVQPRPRVAPIRPTVPPQPRLEPRQPIRQDNFGGQGESFGRGPLDPGYEVRSDWRRGYSRSDSWARDNRRPATDYRDLFSSLAQLLR
jgi:hypothetical protein